MLSDVFRLAYSNMLTLLDCHTNHFFAKKKEREWRVQDLHALLGQLTVTVALVLRGKVRAPVCFGEHTLHKYDD